MTIEIIDKSISRNTARRPLTELRKRKRFGLLFYLAVIGVLFYVAVGCYFAIRYLNKGEPSSPPPVEPVVVEPIEPPPAIPDYPDLRERVFAMLLSDADFCRVDPSLSQSFRDTAVAFATDVGIDITRQTKALKDLPKPMTFAAPPAVAIKSVRREAPVTWIELDVRHPDGRFAAGLTRVDFELTQGEFRLHRMAVSESVKSGRAAQVALLIDASGSTTGEPFRQAIVAAEEFIKQYARRARIKIWVFSSDVRAVSPWTNDVQKLVAALRSLRPDGGTALNRVLVEAVPDTNLLDGPTAIVLFTDGADSFNDIPLQPVLDAAKRNETPIHVVALTTSETKPDILKQISTQTNGTLHMVDRADQLLQKFNDVAAQLVTPVYRIAVIEPYDPEVPLHLSVGGLPAISVTVPK